MFTKSEENVIALCADDNWQHSQAHVARQLGMSKQGVNKVVKRVLEKAPELKPFI
jgi:biotin operon repressor